MLRKFLAVLLLIPLPVLADHVPTQPAYNQSIALDTTTGDLTIGIYTSDGFEDSPPEKYTIWFTISDETIDTTTAYCVSTSFGHTDNLVWNYYVFSLEDLQTYFENPHGTFRTKIRSDNDTDNSYSTLTAEQTITIPNQLPFINLGEWTAPTTTCVDTSTTTTTTSSTTTVPDTTTTSSTTTTTTTTLPPPPPPPPPKVEVVMDDGTVTEYETYEVEDGTVDRDNQRKANEDKYGCYMTDAQIERGDCDIVKDDEEPKPNTETELPDDDVVVPEVEPEDEVKEPEPIKEEDIVEEEVKIDVKELEEEFEFEEEPIIIEDIPKDIVIVIEEEVVEDELDKEIPGDDDIREDTVQEEDVQDEVVQEVEVPEEVIVIQEITEEEVEEVQAVVDTAIANVEELTEEQVEVVAEVLQVPAEDVEIIAEAVKEDEVVAEAVEVYVERAVENADVENYTLADVVTEIQFEQFLENPLEVLVDFEDISFKNIGDDMTSDQKEKAQEVVVPVILTRIVSMAAFVFRRQI